MTKGQCKSSSDTLMRIEKAHHHSSPDAITCPDGQTKCDDDQTCCLNEFGYWGCCPFADAVCCSDGRHCCPSGYQCDVTKGQCVSTDGATFVPLKKKQKPKVE